MTINDCLKNDLSDLEKKKLILNELAENEEEVIDMLIECLKNKDKRVFNIAFSVLSNLNSPILVEKLIDALKTKDSSMRSIIYELFLKNGDKNISALKEKLNDDDYHIRKLIIDVFTNLKLPLEINYIEKLLNDENINVKYSVCEYIIKNNVKDILPELKKILFSTNDEWLISVILDAIGKLGDVADIKDVINYPTNNPVILKNILNIISKLGTTKQLPILLSMLTMNNNDIKKYVIKSLYNLITYNNITKQDIVETATDIHCIIDEVKKIIAENNEEETILQSIAFLSKILDNKDSDCLLKFFDDRRSNDFIYALLNISLQCYNKKFIKIYKKYINSNDYLINNIAREGLKKYKGND